MLQLISQFNNRQRQVKNILFVRLNIPIDIDAVKWSQISRKTMDDYKKNKFANSFKVHGFGLEYLDNNGFIDFDFHLNGRCDGFELWWLYLYKIQGLDEMDRDSNNIVYDELKIQFNKLISDKLVYQQQNLFFIK